MVVTVPSSNETSKIVAGFDYTNALSTFGEGLQGAAISHHLF